MPKTSAGLLLYRRTPSGEPEVLLVHPGGPFFAKRDDGVWSLPKGEYSAGDDPLACARREFEEETGSPPPGGDPIELGQIKQRAGKLVTAWALEGDIDSDAIVSNTFPVEWPPRSGRIQQFPEVDRAAWLTVEAARAKILPAQEPFLDRLLEALGNG